MSESGAGYQKVGLCEYYSSKTALESGSESVKKNALEAKVEDLTVKDLDGRLVDKP